MKTTQESMAPRGSSRGFTLIELMIVIAIIGILASVATPQYKTYTTRTKFSEVVLATTAFKTPAELAIQTGRALSADDLDAGGFGIPQNIASGDAVGRFVETVTMLNGVLTSTGTADVQNGVFRLVGTVMPGAGIRWNEDDSVANSCQSLGIC